MRTESELRDGVKTLGSGPGTDSEELLGLKEQLQRMEIKRESLLKEVTHLENEITLKTKDLSKAK